MSFFKRLLKKFHSNKGITGADIALSISIIVLTMGVVTAIYINVINKSRENIRYSNATRIATGIVEKIQTLPYDYIIATCAPDNTTTCSSGNKVFGVTVQNGYTAKITASPLESAEVDLVRDIKVEVSYKAYNRIKTITLYTIKEKELLEETNPPDFGLIKKDLYYYPIKKVKNEYMVTDVDDPDWYNYNKGNYALAYITSNPNITLGTTFQSLRNIDVYAWIPRYGINIVSIEGERNTEQLKYCYGTSSYIIDYAAYRGSLGEIIYGYMLKGDRIVTEGIPDSVSQYSTIEINDVEYSTFEVNDGLSGIWYKLGNKDNSSKDYVIFKDFENRVPHKNIVY